MPPRRATWHCQMASNSVIIISSDEESNTGNAGNMNNTLQNSRPRRSHSSIVGSDASGELTESYYGKTNG